MIFRLPILSSHDRHRVICEAVNKDLEGYSGQRREAEFDKRYAAASDMIKRFSIEFDVDRSAARLIDSQSRHAAHKFGAGFLEVGTTGDGGVILQLPSDIPIATTGYIGFSPDEAKQLAALLIKKASEAQVERT